MPRLKAVLEILLCGLIDLFLLVLLLRICGAQPMTLRSLYLGRESSNLLMQPLELSSIRASMLQEQHTPSCPWNNATA